MTTHDQNNHIKPKGDDDDIVITEAQVREVFPTDEEKEEIEFARKPISLIEAEEAVGGDVPVDGVAMTNMNNEDEELEKEADII